MKQLIYCLIILFAFSLSVYGQTSKPGKAEREVRATIDLWADAVKMRDAKTLTAIFADDLFITDYNGATRGKNEEMEILKPTSAVKTVSVENENIVVRLYGNSKTAVVTAVVKMLFEIGGKQSTLAMRYTSVWEKRKGKWQLVVLQSVRVAPPKVN